VLAFTDESIVRLVIAATAVPRRSRGCWLRKLAGTLGTERRRKADAVRAGASASAAARRRVLSFRQEGLEVLHAVSTAFVVCFFVAARVGAPLL